MEVPRDSSLMSQENIVSLDSSNQGCDPLPQKMMQSIASNQIASNAWPQNHQLDPHSSNKFIELNNSLFDLKDRSTAGHLNQTPREHHRTKIIRPWEISPIKKQTANSQVMPNSSTYTSYTNNGSIESTETLNDHADSGYLSSSFTNASMLVNISNVYSELTNPWDENLYPTENDVIGQENHGETKSTHTAQGSPNLITQETTQTTNSVSTNGDALIREQYCTQERDTSSLKRVSKRKPLSSASVQILDNWYQTNIHYPYPTATQVAALAVAGNISTVQVKKWMANKRVRSYNTLSFSGSIHPKRLQRLQLQQLALNKALQHHNQQPSNTTPKQPQNFTNTKPHHFHNSMSSTSQVPPNIMTVAQHPLENFRNKLLQQPHNCRKDASEILQNYMPCLQSTDTAQHSQSSSAQSSWNAEGSQVLRPTPTKASLALLAAAHDFTTPFAQSTPKREYSINNHSIQSKLETQIYQPPSQVSTESPFLACGSPLPNLTRKSEYFMHDNVPHNRIIDMNFTQMPVDSLDQTNKEENKENIHHTNGRQNEGRFSKLGERASSILKHWYRTHIDRPYPTSEEKAWLVNTTGLSKSQINCWFTNKRRRVRSKN